MSPPVPERTASDAVLIQGVARGDLQAFAALYDRHAAILFGIALRILRGRSEAEEVLRKVFVEIWQCARSLDARRGPLFPWLTLLARRRALDHLHRSGARDRAAEDVADEKPPVDEDSAGGVTLESVRVAVRKALTEMSEDERATWMLAYFRGLTESEIAERLGTPLGMAKTHMRLGLARLRKLLEEVGAQR